MVVNTVCPGLFVLSLTGCTVEAELPDFEEGAVRCPDSGDCQDFGAELVDDVAADEPRPPILAALRATASKDGCGGGGGGGVGAGP
jgi:hypothetical protein